MNIVYGVLGIGMGHTTRSKVAIDYLRSRGHRVMVVASGRAYNVLSKDSPDVIQITGMTTRFEEGSVQWLGTAIDNVLRIPRMLASQAEVHAFLGRYGARLVISDFETLTGQYALLHRLPLVALDNIHAMSRLVHDPELLRENNVAHVANSIGAFLKLPPCDRYLITSFFRLPVLPSCKRDTELVPPVVREAIVRARSRRRDDGPTLVYQTSDGDPSLFHALSGSPGERFVVYGTNQIGRLGNCEFMPFSDEWFVADLAACKAVITNGGMSLMGEAIYLGKPVHSVPVKSQFEQSVNAWYLERLGYGTRAASFTPDAVRAFLASAPSIRSRVRSAHRQDGNLDLYRRLDQIVAEVGARD